MLPLPAPVAVKAVVTVVTVASAEAVAAVESGKVKSWNAQTEQVWARVPEDGFQPLLDKYLERPGVLLRSMTRLAKAGVSADELCEAAGRSDAYSLPSIVRTLTMMSAEDSAVDALGVGVRALGDPPPGAALLDLGDELSSGPNGVVPDCAVVHRYPRMVK